ncbi:metal ABC transporter substrate-binding protein [Enterovirga sp.]|uniref:metal ABC transporter substrate-binding protein n=1 Tax=Enterovirga sp. TaxID=2026350 RepID=UPI002CF5C807|nr:metal ABC transporter substrate-binding protein [Enterovirga sp.]HMO29703.1 metal ABC transporter substrate-binding protein [Enterovirga sp.]
MADRGWRWIGRLALLCLLVLPAGVAVAVAEAAKPKRVVTTFTVIRDMARNVAGDKAIVESITKPGAEIHGYEPTPLDIVKAQNADLVLWNGLNLERWFEKFFGAVEGVPSAVLTEGITPIPIADGPYGKMPNPHAWMSPANALIYVENIRKALAAVDPANADSYAANAARYSAELKALAGPIRDTLAKVPADRRILVSCEGAFSYLARDYDLAELYLWAVNSDEQGSPQQIRRVVDEVRRKGVPTVFCESTVSDKAMRQVAKETKANFGGVLHVDSLTTEDGPAPTYLKLLGTNAQTIVKGFGLGG